MTQSKPEERSDEGDSSESDLAGGHTNGLTSLFLDLTSPFPRDPLGLRHSRPAPQAAWVSSLKMTARGVMRVGTAHRGRGDPYVYGLVLFGLQKWNLFNLFLRYFSLFSRA